MNRKSIPTILTLCRIVFIIPLILLVMQGNDLIAFLLFTAITLTDFLDGFLARRWEAESRLGAFLDPIADKLLVIAIMFTLVANGTITGIWLALPILITAREIWVPGLRGFLPSGDLALPVSKLAKWKTTAQMVALALLILAGKDPISLSFLSGFILLIVATVLTVKTGWSYTKAAMPFMLSNDDTDDNTGKKSNEDDGHSAKN